MNIARLKKATLSLVICGAGIGLASTATRAAAELQLAAVPASTSTSYTVQSLDEAKQLPADAEVVDYNGAKVSDPAILDELCKRAKIRSLSIQNCKDLGKDAGDKIARLANIESLCFDRVAAIGSLAKLPSLKKLSKLKFDGCEGAKDADLMVLKDIATLESLYIGSCNNVSAAVLKCIPSLKKLSELAYVDYSKSDVSDESLKVIAQAGKLDSLTLTSAKATKAGYAELSKLTSLANLALYEAPGLQDEGLEVIAKLPLLEGFRMAKAAVSDDGIKKHLPAMRKLNSLTLQECLKVTDEGLTGVAAVSALHMLELSNMPKITAKGIAKLAGLKELESLTFFDCGGINDSAVDVLATMKKLSQLDIDSTKISRSGALKLHKALPDCEITSRFLEDDGE